jgi:hypothetical protein
MEDQTKERWYQLCGQAAVEQDPKKLLALVTEINSLLDMRGQIHSRLGASAA